MLHFNPEAAMNAAYDPAVQAAADYVAAEDAARKVLDGHTDGDEPDDTWEASAKALDRLGEVQATSIAGIAAKAGALLHYYPDGSEIGVEHGTLELAVSLAKDAIRLSASSPCSVSDARLQLVLAAALPWWTEGADTAWIAWALTIDGPDLGVVTEAEVATALARHKDGLLQPALVAAE